MKFVLADRSARPLTKKEVDQLLSKPNILRLAVVDERDGLPIVHPVWYVYKKGVFLVATDRDGIKARSLRKNPIAYFLVDIDDRPPQGVRGRGNARVVDDPAYATEVTRENVMKYLGTLKTRTAKSILAMGSTSSVLEITPAYMATWKY
ncbi:MAG: pyridoxamine 5'-phosphate oxidase family protein [Nitrososphaera sp.]